MIQFRILTGKQAEKEILVRDFPFVIGRGADSNLCLDDAGVWDRHFQIDFHRREGFSFVAHAEALALINGQKVQEGFLRNGDLIELGSVQLRFWLARTRQKTLRVREAITWSALAVLFAAQIALIFWLLH